MRQEGGRGPVTQWGGRQGLLILNPLCTYILNKLSAAAAGGRGGVDTGQASSFLPPVALGQSVSLDGGRKDRRGESQRPRAFSPGLRAGADPREVPRPVSTQQLGFLPAPSERQAGRVLTGMCGGQTPFLRAVAWSSGRPRRLSLCVASPGAGQGCLPLVFSDPSTGPGVRRVECVC